MQGGGFKLVNLFTEHLNRLLLVNTNSTYIYIDPYFNYRFQFNISNKIVSYKIMYNEVD